MPLEKEDFRDNLQRVTEAFPAAELIPAKDAAGWLGISVRALYGVKSTPCKRVGGRYYVTAVALARWMS
jgi:hypothetical protein